MTSTQVLLDLEISLRTNKIQYVNCSALVVVTVVKEFLHGMDKTEVTVCLIHSFVYFWYLPL